VADISDPGGFRGPDTLDGGPGRAIVLSAPAPAVQRRPELAFSPEQEQLIRDSFANGASEQEFAVLMEVARARRLNPFLRQIHFVKRWNSQLRREVWSAQAAIDGLRSIAEDSGKYAGQDEPEFEYGEEKTPKNPHGIRLCRVKVYRKDWPRPCVGVAHWSEYVQTTKEGQLTPFWRDKGHVMISKCAEALGLRKGFPEEMAGLYVPEEMGQEPLPELPPRKLGSGAAGPGTRISPHDHPDAPDDPTKELDGVFSGMMRELHDLEQAIDKVSDYGEALTLKTLLGTLAIPSELTKRMQRARETQQIGGEQYRELSRQWQKNGRALNKRLKALEPDALASFTDPGDVDDREADAGHDERGVPR
jgi:phage recombination protein Bet